MCEYKLQLRALEPNDLDVLSEIENDQTVWSVSDTSAHFSRHQLSTYINSLNNNIYETSQLRQVIELEESNGTKHVAGLIDLFDFDSKHMRAGFGIVVLNQFRNKKVASKALKLLINQAFNIIGLNLIHASAFANSKASHNMLISCGFRHVGVLKQWRKIGQNFLDENIYQILSSDLAQSD